MANWNRRNILSGALRGAAVSVALPFLDLFLDGNGEALAASGAPLPVRFGTWFWGCGINEKRFYPDQVGRDFTFKEETAALAPFKDKVTIFSGFNALLDGNPNLTHWSGIMTTLTGTVPNKGGNGLGVAMADTLDCLVADHIGKGTRFKQIQIACTGQAGVSYSLRTGATVNPSEVDPTALYTRLFGPGFQDPNSGVFKPDPVVMTEKSVLSAVSEQRRSLARIVGAADRERLDQYYTSIREMEQRLSVQLQPPPRADACMVAKAPAELAPGTTWEDASSMHDRLTDLMVMALACNQTRVFHIALSQATSNLRRAGESDSLHGLSHEEPMDPKLGYQPKVTYFLERHMPIYATLLAKLDKVKEGNGTLLDNSLILATSEANLAKLHTLESLPMIVGGTAGGRWKSGLHINGKGDSVTRVGLTIQQALGMPVGTWGTGANMTSKPISEVLA